MDTTSQMNYLPAARQSHSLEEAFYSLTSQAHWSGRRFGATNVGEIRTICTHPTYGHDPLWR